MRRRDFITVLGAAATWPITASAQRPAMPVIGFLGFTSPVPYAHVIAAFRDGLKEAGYTEGENIAIEWRWAQHEPDRLPALAAELVGRQVAVIATTGTPAALAAKAATTTIPIVFEIGFDPVTIGLVANLHRPDGNLTGVTNLSVEVEPKTLELLHELIPAATSIALLVNPANHELADVLSRNAEAAASKLGLKLHIVHASSDGDFDAAFATLSQLRVGALMIGSDAFFVSRSGELARLTLSHRIPASFQFREFAVSGGLISYGSSITEGHHLAGVYTGRILAGAKPADLPVVRPTKLELVINLKTAKTLGMEIPPSVLYRANEVIE